MLTIKKGSLKSSIDFNDTLISFIENPNRSSQNIRQKVKKIFIKAKKDRIRNAFVSKLIRGVDSDDATMLSLWKQQICDYESPLEGVIYRQGVQHLVQILSLVVFPILLILSSFSGFLDEYTENYGNHPAVISFKVACFIITIVRLVVKCTAVTFSDGLLKIYLSQIIVSYFKSHKLVFDLVFIMLQLLFLIFPLNSTIATVLFYYINLTLIYPGRDTHRIEAAYIHKKKIALLWQLVKIVFFNLFFAHFTATIILAMSKIDPQNNWIVRLGITGRE